MRGQVAACLHGDAVLEQGVGRGQRVKGTGGRHPRDGDQMGLAVEMTLEHSSLIRPYPGEQVSGDAAVVRSLDGVTSRAGRETI